VADWTAEQHRKLASAARAQASASWHEVARALIKIAEEHEAKAEAIEARIEMPPPNQ
jgi:hypothetical protein